MRVASLAEVVRGSLLNGADIEIIGNFVFDSHRVKRGDCYFYFSGDEGDLARAVAGGAFAIVAPHGMQQAFDFGGGVPIVCVDDGDHALRRLLRFLCIGRGVTVLSASQHTIDIARSLITQTRLREINSVQKAIDQFNSDQIFLCENSSEFTELLLAKPLQQTHANILKNGIYETAILTREGVTICALPSFFADHLATVIDFAHNHALQINTKRAIGLQNIAIITLSGSRTVIIDSGNDQRMISEFFRRECGWTELFMPPQCPLSELAVRLNQTHFAYAYIRVPSGESSARNAAQTLTELITARTATTSLFAAIC